MFLINISPTNNISSLLFIIRNKRIKTKSNFTNHLTYQSFLDFLLPKTMAFIHTFMNIAFPPVVLILLILFLPISYLFKLIRFVKRSICTENVAGKVVLITGAASGIGEVHLQTHTYMHIYIYIYINFCTYNFIYFLFFLFL